MDKSKSEDIVLHQLKYAAAIAVLHAKPAEADAYQYTKQLCTKYLQAQTQWRSRYLQAQEAVLHLKQQQTICMAQSEEHVTESVCLPTPPSSASDEADGHSSGQPVLTVTRQQALLSSYRFIHTVVSLARVLGTESFKPSNTDAAMGESRHHACPGELLSRLDTLLTETVPSCVGHLREVVSKGDTDVSTQCVMQGLDGLMLLLDADWMESVSTGCHSRLLLEQLSSLIDDLLERLFRLDSYCVIQCVRTSKLLHQMLLQLTTRMRAPEKFSLLHSVATHAKTLCAAITRDISSGETINPDCYDSLGIALDCLQQGIASVKVGDIHVESLKEIQQEMESVLESDLIYRFPLVARTVLRLTSLIELCGKSQV